jgi:lipopolysaccharide transport system ATP-binding protein
MKKRPTVFHITHHKAGSQWVAEVLKFCAPDRIVLPEVQVAHFRKIPIKRGKVYLTVYVSKQEFDTIMGIKQSRWKFRYLWNWYHFQICSNPYLTFVVIRDLRDALISLYFGKKNIGPLLTPKCLEHRNILQRLNKQEGFLFLMKEVLPLYVKIQMSWIDNKNILLIKYEELLRDEYTTFERLIDYCQINISRERLHEIIRNNSFEMVTGRNRGNEDVTVHQRKGVAGDWRNHFSERVKKEFKRRFGDVLIQTGYERSYNW